MQLVVSDAHEGLKTAIASVLLGSTWQRCRVHFTRNVLDAVSKTNAEMVAAAIRTIFAQPDAAHVHEQFDVIETMLARSHAKVAALLTDAREDLLAFSGVPMPHWEKVWSTKPLERLNREVKRRPPTWSGSSPTPRLLRLAGAVLIEAHDEWAATDRRYLSERSMAQLAAMTALTAQEVDTTELFTAWSPH